MKKLIYILNIIFSVLFFASCEDDSVMASSSAGVEEEGEGQYYYLYVKTDNLPQTRAHYNDPYIGSEIGDINYVEFDPGDVIYIHDIDGNKYKFVNGGLQGTSGYLFAYFGQMKNADHLQCMVAYGKRIDQTNLNHQYQPKNNDCRECLIAVFTHRPNLTDKELVSGTDYLDFERIGTNGKKIIPEVDLLPADGLSLIHVRIKNCPVQLLGGSLLEIKGLGAVCELELGKPGDVDVFCDKDKPLDAFFIVDNGIHVPSHTEFKLFLYAYDKMIVDDYGDVKECNEYHYYMENSQEFTIENDKVVFMKLPDIPTHYAIQLGLPSGRKWSGTNIGTKYHYGYGKYFAWGYTDGVLTPDKTNIKFRKNQPYDCVTYGKTQQELFEEGFLDNTGILVPEHDAATENWGEMWEMPTKEDIEELIYNATWGFNNKIEHSTKGSWVRSKKYYDEKKNRTDCQIFFPYSGYRDYDVVSSKNNNDNSGYGRAYVWTKTYTSTAADAGNDKGKANSCAVSLDVFSNDKTKKVHEKAHRFTEMPIRPVLKRGGAKQ